MVQKGQFKAWMGAMRLRTLPLAAASIILGSALAAQAGQFRLDVMCLALSTALLLQILSNFANDLGDFKKGTDDDGRIGPQRALQSGNISIAAMKSALIVTSLLALISGCWLIYTAFHGETLNVKSIGILVLGILAIGAALKYTLGRKAYGYAGFGELSVFIFFGLAGVLVMAYLHGQTINWWWLQPASAMGLFASAVLNLNNMRDIENDLLHGKKTLAARMGIDHAKTFHASLIIAGWACIVVYWMLADGPRAWLLTFAPMLLHFRSLKKTMGNVDRALLDAELPKIAMPTFLYALIYGVLVWVYHV